MSNNAMFVRSGPEPTDNSTIFTEGDFRSLNSDIVDQYTRRRNELLEYVVLVEEDQDMNDFANASPLFAKLSYGMRKASEANAWMMKLKNDAKTELYRARGSAALDKFNNFIDQTMAGEKITATTKEILRKQYVEIDQSVLDANRVLGIYSAMEREFENLHGEFTRAIAMLKASMFRMRQDADNLSMSGANSTIERN